MGQQQRRAKPSSGHRGPPERPESCGGAEWIANGVPMGDVGQGQIVTRVQQLRRDDGIAREAASVPTSGSASVDRMLLALAERLERDASILEGIRGISGRT